MSPVGGGAVKHAGRRFLILMCLVLAALLLLFGSQKIMQWLYPQDYSELVTAYAQEQQLDPTLVYAVIKCESGFRPDAVSSVGAKGLMQLTDDTFYWLQSKTGEKLEPDALFDPATNIRYGTLLLRLHLDEFGDAELALAAYHAGRSRVNQWLKESDGTTGKEIIQYADTRQYVTKVLETQDLYRSLY